MEINFGCKQPWSRRLIVSRRDIYENRSRSNCSAPSRVHVVQLLRGDAALRELLHRAGKTQSSWRKFGKSSEKARTRETLMEHHVSLSLFLSLFRTSTY